MGQEIAQSMRLLFPLVNQVFGNKGTTLPKEASENDDPAFGNCLYIALNGCTNSSLCGSVTLLFFVVFAVRRYSISGGVVGSHYIPSGGVSSGDKPCMIIYGT